MATNIETRFVKLSEVKFDETIYPRKAHSPALVQRYAECIAEIEAKGNYICVSPDMTLLDGRHRHLGYQKASPDQLDRLTPVYVYLDATTEKEKFAIAVELNSIHGDQLSDDDKRSCTIDLYAKYHYAVEDIAKLVSARKQRVLDWTKGVREEQERRLNESIFDLWLACHTQEEIAEATGLEQKTVDNRISTLLEKEFPGTKLLKLSKFEDAGDGFDVPIYNVWTFAKKSNEVGHFGNSEQRILENLLYLYTEPFDIVVDPFAGGGATIDVCKKRLRRYWCSDRKPILERVKEIRQLDVAKELPRYLRWSEVTLTYLDPPYWRQAQGKYSKDAEDLANMPLEQFTKALAGVIKGISQKQSHGVIAMLMQPTQWNADNREVVDHIVHIINAVGNKRLTLETRVSCPYSTEQCTPQMVEWAKEQKKLLVLTRELVVWRVGDGS